MGKLMVFDNGSCQQQSNISVLLPGKEFNAKVKTLANGENCNYDKLDQLIKHVLVNVNDSSLNDNPNSIVVSTPESVYPIKASFELSNNTLTISTQNDKIYLNENSSNLFYMFAGLSDADLDGFNTSNVINIARAFEQCFNLTNVDALSNWNVSKVWTMEGMFCSCSSIKSINVLSNWDTSSLTNTSYMFRNCSSLVTINGLSDLGTNKITSMIEMFYNCSKVNASITISNNDCNVQDFAEGAATEEGSKLIIGYAEGCKEKAVEAVGTKTEGANVHLNEATLLPGKEFSAKIKSLALGEDVDYETECLEIHEIYYRNTVPPGLPTITVSDLNSETEVLACFEKNTGEYNDTNILYLVAKADMIYLNPDSSYMFCKLGINGLNISAFDTSKVVDMDHMFWDCIWLWDLSGLSNWNVSNVTKLSWTFAESRQICNKNGLDELSKWNVSNVTDMYGLFGGIVGIENLNVLSNWNVGNVENMSTLFVSCKALTDINGVSNWDTSSVKNMYGLFGACESLTNLDSLSNWNVSNVENMDNMFIQCIGLTDASGINDWDIKKALDRNGGCLLSMFARAYVHPDFTIAANDDDAYWENGSFYIGPPPVPIPPN